MGFLRYLNEKATSFDARDNNKNLLLSHAKNNSSHTVLMKMIDLGCTSKVVDYYGKSPLMFVAEHGNTSSFATLRDNGAIGDVKCHLGKTVLHYACRPTPSGHSLFCSKHLINEAGNYHATVDKEADYVNTIHMICRRYKEVIDVQDKDGNSALMKAVSFPEHLKALIGYCPNPYLKNKKGETALDIAEKYNYKQSKKIILSIV